MPNPNVQATATGLPNSSRRLFLAAGSAAAVFTTVKSAAALAADNSEAQLLAFEGEITRFNIAARKITAERINPYDDEYHRILDIDGLDAAFAYSISRGRDAAITAVAALDDEAAPYFERLMAIPATTQPGRAAKVRCLMIHVLPDSWRGPEIDNWHDEQVRNLLAEFAGMSAEEISLV